MDFISADEVFKEKINEDIVTNFIYKFNTEFAEGEDNGDKSFSLNTQLDDIPYLNKLEFDHCSNLANKKGWDLTQFDDKNNSVTYKMKKIPNFKR